MLCGSLEKHSVTSSVRKTKMGRLTVLVCLAGVCVASALATVLDPRGARPVEPATRSEKCATEKEWPFCTDDDWGYKCPSGCRIQGLMDKYEHSLLKKIAHIRSLLDQNKAKHRSADQVSKQTYDYLKEKLTTDAGNDNSYYDLAQNLRQSITNMKIKIDSQLRRLSLLKDRVKDQVVEIQRLEVDIDIKLRSCKGSCVRYSEYQVDKESYVNLDKQITQLDARAPQNIESVGSLYVMKSRPLQDVVVDSIFKSKDTTGKVATQQKEDFFPDVKTVQLLLEHEGSSSSPATISKVPGTSYSSSTSSSSSSSSSSSTSSKSITELGGRGDSDLFGTGLEALGKPSTSHVSTKQISCTKSIRGTIVHTKDGPVEKMEEVIEGGPECQDATTFTKGGMSSLFPTLTHTSSSSSSSVSTKTIQSGGAKGSLLGDSKTEFGDPFGSDVGIDLGAFLTDNAEDDLPDFHARSVKSMRVERQADYIGKDCVEAYQNHLAGETNGLFKIRPGGTDSTEVVQVYCQQEGLMGGWVLVQQRQSGLSFNRTWAEYRNGFGSVNAQGIGDVWLGNQNIHLLTKDGETMLKVELEDWEGGSASAEYTVRVGSEEEGYVLHVSGYTGDAGDALVMPASNTASHLSHNGMKFSTFDKDSDKWEENCAQVFGGGWWYNNCQAANLNGIYYKGEYDPKKNAPYEVENGVVWVTFKPATYSMKTVRMFLRPAAF
ncbi:fibrinogen alpha chain-like [Betta splendens]|uniref:Fibrinogen alpha chain-like n=1 Tax=Betta splendens TaxID=158456 RepID=A0A6P7LXZ9_BETSP|nr:fibrinogen alpha chain-like [Betta splendens]